MGPIRLINSRSLPASDILRAHRVNPAKSNQPNMKTTLHLLLIAVQVVLIFGFADFVAGVVHWAEDAYFTEETPIIGAQIIRPNIVHHHFPRYFTKLSWWESAQELVLVSAVLLAIAWPLGLISWQLLLFTAVSINANEIHKMAHRTRAENGRFVSLLQD